jgi:HAD superfamily hydrolase (TIGR01509 family)
MNISYTLNNLHPQSSFITLKRSISMPIKTDFPFEAVLWDMDGTLIDSEKIWIEEEHLLMKELGVKWTEEDAKHCLGGPMERVDAYMRSRTGGNHQPLELSNLLIGRMVERLSQGVDFTIGAEELLSQMRSAGLPLALVSASTRQIVNAALKSIGTEYFAFTCSADDVTNSKPHPEGYLLAAKQLGVDIGRTLIIEDSHTGMRSAIDSGAFVLGLPHLTDLPMGEKVVHRSGLESLDLDELGKLFAGKIMS